MARQDEPFGVQSEQRGEILAPLRLTGIEGRIIGLLDERKLLFERRDGKGLRIELENVQRVRHHHVPITPPGVTWIGVITMILAARVLTGPIQLYALAIGAITIFTWLIGRRPALCIDTKAGDRHVLHGRDSLLLRTQMMVNRLCEGKTLEEAREGLEELHRHSNYPMISPLQAMQMETAAIHNQVIEEAVLLPEPDVFDEADLERALANMYNGREDNIPEPQPANTIFSPTVTESFASESHADQAGRGLLERARGTLQETRSNDPEWAIQVPSASPTTDTQWERPWEQPTSPVITESESSAYERAWGRQEPNWYQEKNHQPNTRIQSALSEAKHAGDFLSTNMFDDPTSAQTTDTGIFGNMFDDPAPISNQTPTTTVMPEPAQFVEGQPTWSGQAIRNVMPTSSALATTLPEPTLHALREECTPGVVAAARMREEELRSTQQQTSQQTTVHRQEIEELSGFPAISSIIRSSPPPRIQNVSVKKEGRFARLAKRSLQIFQGTNGQKSISTAPRPVRIQSDDYASTYGDQDGFDDGVYRDVPLRSGQIIRLRADQDHQAEVADRLRNLSRSTGGEYAEDEANKLIGRLAASGDLEPIANLLKAADKKLTFGNLASTSPPKEAPGHHGISRLG
jgi:hypothetical protein